MLRAFLNERTEVRRKRVITGDQRIPFEARLPPEVARLSNDLSLW